MYQPDGVKDVMLRQSTQGARFGMTDRKGAIKVLLPEDTGESA